MKTRKIYLDNIAGLFIIIMILGHTRTLSGHDSSYVSFLELYLRIFMPFFFYKSGMFFKSTDIKVKLKNVFRKFIIPYIAFYIFTIPYIFHDLQNISIVNVIVEQLKQFLLFGCSWANFPLWFLFSISCVIVIFEILNRRMHPILIALIGMVVSIMLNAFNVERPYYAGNISSGLFYYSMGYLLREKQCSRKILIGLFLFYCSFLTIWPQHIEMVRNSCEQGNFIIWFPLTVIGVYSFIGVFSLYNKKIPILSYLGRHSMIYYVAHWGILEYVSLFTQNKALPNYETFTIMIVACICILPFLDLIIKKTGLQWIIGKKIS